MKKKIISGAIALSMCFCLVACNNTEASGELDYKSLLDTETGNIISLGDTRDMIDEKLGEGEYESEYTQYIYASGLVTVIYNKNNDTAYYIEVSSNTNRFEFKDMSFDMDSKYIAGNFETSSDSGDPVFYVKYYDSVGNVVGRYEAEYCANISVYEGHVSSCAIISFA